MKRIYIISMVLACGIACAGMTSCGKSAEKKAEAENKAMDQVIERYEAACAEGDFAKAMSLGEELKQAELTPEQSVRVITASTKGTQVAAKGYKDIIAAMPYNMWDIQLNKYEDLIKQYAGILKQKADGKKVKDQLKRQEEKVEALKDKLDDAQLTKAQKARFKKLKEWYDEIED